MQTILGIEAFLSQSSDNLGRIGLLSNQSAILNNGKPTWLSLLHNSFKIVVLFGPEHGFLGNVQDAIPIENGKFANLPVISLFKNNRFLEGRNIEIDTVIYDIQDIGCRYYTYIYTLAQLMEWSEKKGVRVLVMDRPNPIGAHIVEGNAISPEYQSFVGGYQLSHRYGMTVGEFACYLQHQFFPDVDLKVHWMMHYSRNFFYNDTRLPWVMPSPNIPTIDAALLYTGTCLFEGTNLSEGRGTTKPFELFGAPWIDAASLQKELSEMKIPGTAFSPVYFTPTFSKYSGQLCEGVLIHVRDREKVNSLKAGIYLLRHLADKYSGHFTWKPLWENENQYFIDKLAGGPYLRSAIDQQLTAEEIINHLTKNQNQFEKVRVPFLHYS